MNLEVAKTFERNSVRYRPGDPLPSDLDKQTLDHYKRHGMVRPASRAPGEKKPIRQRAPARMPRTNTQPLPTPTQTAAAEPGALGIASGPVESTALPPLEVSSSATGASVASEPDALAAATPAPQDTANASTD